ncbi:MAG TPA: hypothetical protein VGM39_21760 [Kofleriaceae bacterium]|jgi:sugar lactone lactonase YvrE
MRTTALLFGLLAASAPLISACATSDGQEEQGPEDGFDDTVGDGKADFSGVSVHTVHRFADKNLFTEGGALDTTEHAFYVGSLTHGNITKVAADGKETIFYAGTGEENRYTLGMQADAARRLLWVCTTKDSLGSVWLFDLATGQRKQNIDLTRVQPKASCNDVLIDTDGSVLVSDRENRDIYRVDAQGHASTWAHDDKLHGALVSLNSMVFTPDHSAVLTATYLPPTLVRVSTSNPRDVVKVKLDGALFMDGFNVLNGPDDLLMHGDELIVAFGSSIKSIVPDDASWKRATVSSERSIGGVTALVEDGARVYGINGQSVRFLLHLPPSEFQIFTVR